MIPSLHPGKWYSYVEVWVGKVFTQDGQWYKVTHVEKKKWNTDASMRKGDDLYMFNTRPSSRTEAAVEDLLK